MAVLTAQRGSGTAWRWLRWLLLGPFLWLPAGGASLAPPTEDQVKAAFLLNFTTFIEWPAHAFRNREAPMVVGIMGDDPFGQILDELVKGESVAGRPIVVRRLKRNDNPAGCHLLFLGDSERARWARILRMLGSAPCVTVANGPDFLRAGGVIEFTTDRGRVRFRINDGPARAAQIVVSSRLLRLAQPPEGDRTPP